MDCLPSENFTLLPNTGANGIPFTQFLARFASEQGSGFVCNFDTNYCPELERAEDPRRCRDWVPGMSGVDCEEVDAVVRVDFGVFVVELSVQITMNANYPEYQLRNTSRKDSGFVVRWHQSELVFGLHVDKVMVSPG